jgi:hypothetical protein
MSDTSGFYALSDTGRLTYAPNYLTGSGWQLVREDKDTYTYPVNGWVWADSEQEAKEYFGLAVLEAQRAAEVAAYTTAVQQLLDSKAQERGYDNILSAASYVNSMVPRFAQEGMAYRDWRDLCWDRCSDILRRVDSGQIPKPTVEELINGLPPLELPYPV